jgi:predicted metal-dependent TIM-barrel fold hydrolase
MAELGKMGAYIGLFMYGDVPNFNNPHCDPMEMFEIIRAVGADHIVLASDLGTVVNMPPWEGMKLFMRILLAYGISKADIRKMARDNSSGLLGLQ